MYQEFKVIMQSEYCDGSEESQIFKIISDAYDNLIMLKVEELCSFENDEMDGFKKK